MLRLQDLSSEPEYKTFVRKVMLPLWKRHCGSLTVESQPSLREHAGFYNIRPDAAAFQAVNRNSVPPDDAGQRGCELKRPDTAAVGVPSNKRATATHEGIVAGLQSYKDHVERGALVKHDSITQALMQMAAGRASLGVLLCAQYIVLLAIVVDRHAKGVHVVAFPSPTMCRPGQGDAPPYQVLLEAIQRVQYLKRPDPDCYKGTEEAGKREILVKGLTDAGGASEAGDHLDPADQTPGSGDDTHDRSRPLEAEDLPRQTGASSSGAQQALKDDRSVERDTLAHTEQEEWSIDLKHRSFLDMIYFGHPQVMFCHGCHGELAAVKIAVDEEGSASLNTGFKAYTAMASLQGTIVPRMYAKCKVWLPTAAQWRVPCIVLQWMGFENGDSLSEQERSKPELHERIMHLHRECAKYGVVQNDPAWRNIGVVRKDGEIDQVYLYDFGLCILKANEYQIQAGLAAVSRALFGKSADGSEHIRV
eukprot:jgi/Ulvmu1/7958/UM004_0191.1